MDILVVSYLPDGVKCDPETAKQFEEKYPAPVEK